MSKDNITHWIKPEIQEMKAYHVQDASGLIKLDAMENPYQWPAELQEQWLAELQDCEINRYPDPAATDLKQSLKKTLQIPDNFQLMFGNGSDEIIQIIVMAIATPGRVIMAPEPSFVMYKMIAQVLGLEYVGVPLREDYSLDQTAMLAAIETHDPAVIFLAYPNNPTGNLFNSDTINSVLEATRGLVVVDEAYHIFSDSSYVDKIGQHDNLLVMRTLSKVGLAGLRLGYLIGTKDWLEQFDKVRLPYNINYLSQISAGFFLQHYPVLEQQAEIIKNDRQSLFEFLDNMPRIDVWSSKANFLLFKSTDGDADRIFSSLLEKNILIKKLHGTHPLLDQCLRITIGNTIEIEHFKSTIKDILS